jgi:hypothetical protein
MEILRADPATIVASSLAMNQGRKLMRVMPTLLLAGAAAVLLPDGPAVAEPQVGAVAQQEYLGATGTRESGEARDLVYNETVYANERVDTRVNGATNLVFLDRTNLYVGASSSVVLDKFIYDPNSQKGDVAISFAKGAFRFVTGQIKNKDNVSLKTPTASMVIRGTVLVLFVLADGTSEVNVESGAVDVFVCKSDRPVRVNVGRSLLISSSCEATPGAARTLDDRNPIPKMPTELAQLTDIVPAAGQPPADQPPPDTTLPDWIRGARGDGGHDSGRGRGND